MSNIPTNADDLIDIRDVIARIEELEETKNEFILNESSIPEDESPSWGEVIENKNETEFKWNETDGGIELKQLTEFMEEFKGYGGDEQYKGDWYPITLIRDSYWQEFCEDLVRDIGDLPNELPNYIKSNINWADVAEDLQVDYTSGEFDGVTYWAR